MLNGYEELALYVVKTACKDYADAVNKLWKLQKKFAGKERLTNAESCRLNTQMARIEECTDFFMHEYHKYGFETDWRDILDVLDKRAKSDDYKPIRICDIYSARTKQEDTLLCDDYTT